MSETAIEDHVYDFLADAIDAAEAAEDPDDPSGDPLVGAEIHDTIYRPITKERGIRIGDGESDLSPNAGSTEMEEFDCSLPIVIFSLVSKAERTDRKAARGKMIALAKKVAKLFIDDPTLGNRVNDARIMGCPRGWDSWESKPYSVANMSLLVNDSGGR